MSLEELKNFQSIFNREDFTYISDLNIIKEIRKIIIYCIPNRGCRDAYHIGILKSFLKNLKSFFDWLGAYNIPDIEFGYSNIEKILRECIQSISKERIISDSEAKAMDNKFLYSLSRLLVGIKIAFEPEFVKSTNIGKKEYLRYILDKVEGLGRGFLFNTKGKHAFVNKIGKLNMEELVTTVRLLVRPSKNQIRFYNGWVDLGRKKDKVRILMINHRKHRVYFLYKRNEHKEYSIQLMIPPEKVEFSPV